ncbi:casein kinase I [Drosophila grimshawi]|uniref:non-specific serine/threonine protein kinase n=1 Tax=Drosophila grimshawi TaxID=7222 RepID=B4JSL8_DROGR|nr:casein kinase I [Drosophila grimshawi]EDV94758.1 GH22602 [Drosophila grimshawi]
MPPKKKPNAFASRAELQDNIVGGKYRLMGPIGSGSFGELYRATGLQSGEDVAVKLEISSVKYPQLPREAKIYNILRGGVGFPHLRYFGTEGNYNVLVLDLLGPTLEDLFNFCARTFSLKTTLMLADQILTRVEFLHMNCLLHRDIKPENFLMGLGSERTRLFMIDFGLAKRYYRPRNNTHISYNEHHELIGTARYASVHAHYAEQGRRDDLEAVGYLLLYFLRGRLPWQGISAESRMQKYERIAERKSTLPLHVLCAGIPSEFYVYIKYCRSLQFTEQPDYMYLRKLFTMLFRNNLLQYDHLFDWVDIDWEMAKNKRMMAKRRSKNHNKKDTQDDVEQKVKVKVSPCQYRSKRHRKTSYKASSVVD